MGKSTLYEIVVLWHPDPNNDDEMKTKKSKVIIEPRYELANDEKSLLYRVSREIDEKYVEQMNQIEIIIRPF